MPTRKRKAPAMQAEKMLGVRIPADLHTQLKLHAVGRGESVAAVTERALRALLKRESPRKGKG